MGWCGFSTEYRTMNEERYEDDEDRISKLPDCLLAEILGRLPDTKYAIRTSTLSTRWKHIWTSVPNLVFIHPHTDNIQVNSGFFSFVDKALTQRQQLKLKTFKLHSNNDNLYESRINNWIHYAIECNVEDFSLKLYSLGHINLFSPSHDFLNSSSFTDLALSGCMFKPIGAVSWKNLKSLFISYVNLDEELIENILSGSPVLETLELDTCYYSRLNITSKSVKNLVLSGHHPLGRGHHGWIIEINAPNILSLTIKGRFCLLEILLRNVSSLVEAGLNYVKCPCSYKAKGIEEKMFKDFIRELHHVKDLKVGNLCFQVFARLKAKGFIFPSNLKVTPSPRPLKLKLRDLIMKIGF